MAKEWTRSYRKAVVNTLKTIEANPGIAWRDIDMPFQSRVDMYNDLVNSKCITIEYINRIGCCRIEAAGKRYLKDVVDMGLAM